MNYVIIGYNTYNTRNLVLSIVILILYILFITKLFVAVKFEVLNKRDECDINFYYGKPCRNYITNNVLTDSRLLPSKKNFFQNANANITPILDTNNTFSAAEENQINNNIKKHEKLLNVNKQTIQSQFQNLSQALTYTVSTILENFNSILNTFNINNNDVLGGLQKLKEKVNSSPNAIMPIMNIVNPTIASTTAPLKKLYQSLTSSKVPA